MMSVKVERFSSPGKGNGLRAVSGVPAGGRVWSAAPLAACVSNTLTGEVCSGCFTRRASLRRCSQCRTAPAGVGSVHKRECVCLRDLLPRAPTDSVRLAARILFNPHALQTLVCHPKHTCLPPQTWTSMSEQKRRGLSQLADMLQIYLQPEVPDLMEEMTSLPPSCQDPLSLLAKVACNCFTISDEELKEVGVGLYPSLSLLNHDCRPNCVVVFEGSRLVLRAVKDVCPGEELLISYIDTLRRSEWTAVLENSGSLLSAAECAVPDDNVHKLRVADLALDACVNLGVWGRALTYGLKTLRYYPDPHPAHGLQLMRVGKLHHYLGNTEEALDLLRQGYEILRITHGEENPLTRRLSLKLEQCRAEIRPS
uniref:SET domain-containing protein n=1 Tax=Gadus morhua TaxID=8049 RepID=A0A8C5BY38_GADMO